MSRLHDRSTEQIKRSLRTPQPRNVTTSHAGVASVGATGVKPRQHDCDGDCTGLNAETNAKMTRASSPVPSVQPTPGQLVAAGVITKG